MGSSRLPGKVLKTVDNITLLQIHLDRLRKCDKVSEIIVATTTEIEDEKIDLLAKGLGFKVFKGAERDVLDRFYWAAEPLNPMWVVRVTSDCPLLDPELVDNVIEFAQNHDLDYVSNTIENKYPDGQDVEVFTFEALKKAWKDAKKPSEREHVTPYIRNNSDLKGEKLFKSKSYPSNVDYGNIRMTVDEQEDYILIKKLIMDLGTDKTWKEYADYIIDKNLISINSQFQRNEGYLKSLKEDQK